MKKVKPEMASPQGGKLKTVNSALGKLAGTFECSALGIRAFFVEKPDPHVQVSRE